MCCTCYSMPTNLICTAGLPSDPSIGPMVSLWKGAVKPLTSLAFGMIAAGAFFHYVIKGPNRVSEEIEKELEP